MGRFLVGLDCDNFVEYASGGVCVCVRVCVLNIAWLDEKRRVLLACRSLCLETEAREPACFTSEAHCEKGIT